MRANGYAHLSIYAVRLLYVGSSTPSPRPGTLSVKSFASASSFVPMFCMSPLGEAKLTSWSRYQLQICMLPPCSSMHLVNCWAAPAQFQPWLWAVLACWVLLYCSAGASEELPVKSEPTAWPMEEPIATPLGERDIN